jgi:hypothetical protein
MTRLDYLAGAPVLSRLGMSASLDPADTIAPAYGLP